MSGDPVHPQQVSVACARLTTPSKNGCFSNVLGFLGGLGDVAGLVQCSAYLNAVSFSVDIV